MLLEDGKDVFFELHPIVCLDGELAAVRAVAKRKRAEHVFWMLFFEELIDAMTVGISLPTDAEGQIARNPVFGIWQQIAILFNGRFSASEMRPPFFRRISRSATTDVPAPSNVDAGSRMAVMRSARSARERRNLSLCLSIV